MASLSVGRCSTARSHGGVRGRGNEAPPSGLGQPCPRRWLQRLPEPSGMFLAAWPGAAGWAHGPEDTSQTKASRAGPAARCRSGRLGPRPTPRRHASPSDKRAQAGGTGGAVCACVCACEPATSTVCHVTDKASLPILGVDSRSLQLKQGKDQAEEAPDTS